MAGVFVLVLAGPALAEEKPKEEKKPATPAEQCQALIKEWQDARRAFFKAYREAKTDADRQKLNQEDSRRSEKYAGRFLELAEKNPKDPVAVDALHWTILVISAADSATDTPRNKAIVILKRDHVTSPKVGPVCHSLAFRDDEGSKELLRAVLKKNPDPAVQAEACAALAFCLRRTADNWGRLQKAERDAKLATEYEKTFAKLAAESDALFAQLADKYLDKMKPQQVSSLCQRLSRNTDKGSELVLRRILSLKDQRDAQRAACLYLAQLLKGRSDEMSEAKERDKVQKESEQLFERALKDFADVKAGFLGSVGRHAEAELFELRFLSRGKTAPEIEAEDLDGQKFKLSDYRGKVVLIDFWGNW